MSLAITKHLSKKLLRMMSNSSVTSWLHCMLQKQFLCWCLQYCNQDITVSTTRDVSVNGWLILWTSARLGPVQRSLATWLVFNAILNPSSAPLWVYYTISVGCCVMSDILIMSGASHCQIWFWATKIWTEVLIELGPRRVQSWSSALPHYQNRVYNLHCWRLSSLTICCFAGNWAQRLWCLQLSRRWGDWSIEWGTFIPHLVSSSHVSSLNLPKFWDK